MAKENKTARSKMEETFSDKKRATIEGYERLIGRLQAERKSLEDQVNRDYYDARRYVRSHPEEGVLVSFVSGLAIGYILSKLGGRK